jgi:Protein of unknown function (DUF642)/PEP-CTERM motif
MIRGLHMLRHILAAGALALAPTTALSAQIVTNGGFETPAVSPPCCSTVPPDALDGWTATPNVNVVLGTFSSTNGNLAYEGNQYLDLVGQGGTGSIYQDLATSIGGVYTLTFAYSHNLFTPSSATSASASLAVGSLVDVIMHDTGDTSNLDWRIYSNTFTATDTTTRLTFTNLTGGVNEGVFLDAVSVAAVPEPATWALMLLGFGGIGLAMRRRRRPALAQVA